MPISIRQQRWPALYACLALLSSPAHAALQALDNRSLSEVSGQDGISIRVDLQATVNKASWIDDGGSISLRNVKIDNGCLTPSDCNGRPFGAAQLGLSLPVLGINLPTLEVDVVTNGSGTQQLQFTLPNLTAINQQLVAGGLDPVSIKLRMAADMYVGESRLGSLELRDITDLHGTFKVWGH